MSHKHVFLVSKRCTLYNAWLLYQAGPGSHKQNGWKGCSTGRSTYQRIVAATYSAALRPSKQDAATIPPNA